MHPTILWKLPKNLHRTRILVCLAGGMLLSAQLYAQSLPEWTSASSYGGSGPDIGQAVKVDRDGNRYLTGAFSATAYFPLQAAAKIDRESRAPHSATASIALTSAGGTDVFLVKYDRLGKLRWLIQAGGPEDDGGFDIAFDAGRNVYVTGGFTDSATFTGTNGTETTVTGMGETIFLAKYLPSGVLAWVQTGATQFDSSNQGYGVAVEPITGSVYVTGVSQGNTTFSSSNGTTNSVPGPGTWHMCIAKFDTAGNFQWGQSNQAEVNTVAHKVAVDTHNNAYVTGWMEGQTTFYSNDGNNLTVPDFSEPIQSYPDYPNDAYIVKYDANGNAKWVNHIGGYKGIGTDIATSRGGKVSITGFVGNIADSPEQGVTIVTSQPGGKNINLGGGTLTSPYNNDVFVATYSSAGVLLDAQRFGGAQDDGGSGIAYDDDGNLVVAGIFQNTISFEGRTLIGKGPFSLFVAKFRSHEHGRRAGDDTDCVVWRTCLAYGLDWAKEADGPGIAGFENDPRIGLTARGDVLVTGAYQPAAQFDGFTLGTGGPQNGFVALLSSGDPEEN